MKRVLLDQGLPQSASSLLRAAGWDATHVRELSMQEAADTSILEHALRDSRVIVTLDRDFPQILALTSASRPSVILIRRQHVRAPELLALLQSAWVENEPALERGCVLIISSRSVRLRPLPIK
jgi:predicted nuclease of predicted toxin-antitoxin system